MELEEYVVWVNQAQPGETIVYHIGELARDRGHYGPKMEWISHPVDALARLIYLDWEMGLVELTQRPLSLQWLSVNKGTGLIPLPRQFEYRATRTSKEL